jgi:copper homeostasis protein
MEGAAKLNRIITLCKGKLKILAAGKVTRTNLSELAGLIATDEFHGRKIVGEL